MTITSKDIRELADKRVEEAMKMPEGSTERTRLFSVAAFGDRLADNLDAMREILGVSHLSVEINDRP